MKQVINSYEYDSEDVLGDGNFGKVYKGRHKRMRENVVAIKVVSKKSTSKHSDELGIWKNILLHNQKGPSNSKILDLVAKIADFGVARYLESVNPASTVAGTWTYMAPEVITCQPYDKKADCWSFGVILYEAYVGKVPNEVDSKKS
uniref:Protein kinase domain-containing protein n=1 Tax=Acrobeloides nanus TaxID=290746 RepID=A0A914DHP4_9BILA